jgi:hypothetical protein
LHKIGSRLKQIKDINSVNGVTFLLDSTLGVACDSSSSSEDHDHAVDTSAMWTYQLQLMAIFSAMMGAINVFPVQFNENAAWQVHLFVGITFVSKLQHIVNLGYIEYIILYT